MAAVVADLSGVSIAFQGLSPALETVLRRYWSRFVVPRDEHASWLHLTVSVAGAPAPSGPLSLRDLRAEFARGGGARFAFSHGSVELEEPRRGRLVLAPADGQHQYFALVNLLCAALAWSLPSCGGALLHAAGVVLGQRAFALVGPSGAGKTTWAEAARARGAIFLSDDLLFVAVAAGRVEVLSTPIRADHPDPVGPRRWPLAAFLLPVHGAPPALAPVGALRAAARIAANLPFVGEQLGIDARLGAVVDQLLEGAPVYDLTFGPDPTFLECLEAFAAPGTLSADGPVDGR